MSLLEKDICINNKNISVNTENLFQLKIETNPEKKEGNMGAKLRVRQGCNLYHIQFNV